MAENQTTTIDTPEHWGGHRAPVNALRLRSTDEGQPGVPSTAYGGFGDDRWYNADSIHRIRNYMGQPQPTRVLREDGTVELRFFQIDHARVAEILDAFDAWQARLA
jgi:hypothetical protein